MPELCLVVSNICNFNCRNCHVYKLSKLDYPQKVMDFDTMDKSLSSYIGLLRNKGISNLTVRFYGGEILVNRRNVFNLIEQYDRTNSDMHFHWLLHTNGSLLDRDAAKFLKDHDVDVHISCDGLADVHNKNRVDKFGQPTFERVEKSLELAKEFKLRSQLNSFAMPENILHLRDLVDIARKYNIGRVHIDFFYSRNMLPTSEFLPNYIDFMEYAQNNGIEPIGPFTANLASFVQGIQPDTAHFPGIVVNVDKTFFFYMYPLSRQLALPLDKIAAIIESQDYFKFVSSVKQYFGMKCAGCSVVDICQGTAIRQFQYHLAKEDGYQEGCRYTRAIIHDRLRKCTV